MWGTNSLAGVRVEIKVKNPTLNAEAFKGGAQLCVYIQNSKFEGEDVAYQEGLDLEWNEEVAKERMILGG
jgi:hypothetical protein